MIAIRILVFLATGLTVAACGLGGSAVKRDRFDYNTAIAQSWKDQMLLNVVKLRYAEGQHRLTASKRTHRTRKNLDCAARAVNGTAAKTRRQQCYAKSRLSHRSR